MDKIISRSPARYMKQRGTPLPSDHPVGGGFRMGATKTHRRKPQGCPRS